MTTPAGTTQLQADLIFYGQVAAGALVGYTAGQTLTSSAEAVTKFGLSRLDRGTAGVDTQAILDREHYSYDHRSAILDQHSADEPNQSS